MAKMEVQANTEPTKQSVDVEALLKRIEQLEQANAENEKGKMSVFKAGREIYEWPRTYSYKTWWWVPVLWYSSYRKDATKDLVYKDQFGQWVSNHYLKVRLADGKETDVEVNDFNKNRWISEKVEAEIRTDNKGKPLGIAFNIEGYWEVIVDINAVNE